MAYRRPENNRKELGMALALIKRQHGKGFVDGDQHGRFKNFKRVGPLGKSLPLATRNYTQLASGVSQAGMGRRRSGRRAQHSGLRVSRQQGGKMLEDYTPNQVFEDEPTYFGQGPYKGEEDFLTAPTQPYNQFLAPKDFVLFNDHGIGGLIQEAPCIKIKGPTKLLVQDMGGVIKPSEQGGFKRMSNNYLL